MLICHPNHDEALRLTESDRCYLSKIWDEAPPFQCLVTMRYHAAVYAALWGVPFFSLVHDPKLLSLSKSLGQPYLLLSDMEESSFCASLSGFISGYDSYKHILKARVPIQIDLAKEFTCLS